MRKIIHKLGEADRIMQIVYCGQSEDVLPCYASEIIPENILKIGDLNDFDWSLDSSYMIDSDQLVSSNSTGKIIECTKSYMQTHLDNPVVRELWQKISAEKKTEYQNLA